MSGSADVNPYEPPKAAPAGEAPADQEMSRDDLLAFAGRTGPYYWWCWEKHGQRERLLLGWNWPAAVFSTLWLGYRRMYRECAVVLLAAYVLTEIDLLVGRVLGREALLGFWWSLVIQSVVVGWLGNGLYLRRARAAISRARQEYPYDLPSRRARLASEGGTTWWAVLAVFGFDVLFGYGVEYVRAWLS